MLQRGYVRPESAATTQADGRWLDGRLGTPAVGVPDATRMRDAPGKTAVSSRPMWRSPVVVITAAGLFGLLAWGVVLIAQNLGLGADDAPRAQPSAPIDASMAPSERSAAVQPPLPSRPGTSRRPVAGSASAPAGGGIYPGRSGAASTQSSAEASAAASAPASAAPTTPADMENGGATEPPVQDPTE